MINSILKLFNLRIYRPLPKGFQKYGLKGENLVGAEVGVYQGDNALSLIKDKRIIKLYLIDSYEKELNDKAYIQEQLDRAKKEAYNKLKDYNVIFICENSKSAYYQIKEKLDFVYIDANHNYEDAKLDIYNYWDLLKKNGFLAGHDVYNGAKSNGVLKAVIEFAVKNNLKIHTEKEDWWICKNEKEYYNLVA